MRLRSIEDIYFVSKLLVPVVERQLKEARLALRTEFPPGYEEFMLRFGKGEFSGYFRPYDPERVVADLDSNREWLAHDYWSEGRLKLTRGEREKLILFADTIDSDSFAFLPGTPREIFVLPRHKNRLFRVGPSFVDLLNWVMSSGKVVQPFEVKFFQPWNDYSSLRLDNPETLYQLDEMRSIFQSIGPADYCVFGEEEQSIDFFIQKFGAHLNYLLLGSQEQFIVSFDCDAAQEFLPLLGRALAGKGFRVTEHNRVTALPDLS